MGELGGMSAGFPYNQESICQGEFEGQGQLSYPPCGSGSSYPESGSSYPSPPDMNINSSPAWNDVAGGTYEYDGPHQIIQQNIAQLIITEEPIPKIRFRYQSEKGSHGSMAGRNSTTTQKTWPTVKLVNYPYDVRNQVKIRASLYTEDFKKPHVHKLLGRVCNAETGDCILSLNSDMTCSFSNLGVLFTEKKRVHEVLYNRRIQELRSKGIPEEKLNALAQEAKQETKQEAKEMKVNIIRIRFEALDGNTMTPITPAVFSEPVNNLKSPESGELKITRLSRFSSSSEGGEEVFLLCEKVNKKDIKVRFFEVNEQNEEVWEAFGKFADSDVHHQVAIVFKTPPYSDGDINKPVKVGVQLYRQNDGERSESLEFTYRPRDKDPDNLGLKRKRPNHDDFKDFEGDDAQGPYLSPPGQFPQQPQGGGHPSSGWGDQRHHQDYPMMPGGHNYQGGNQLVQFVDRFAESLQVVSSPSSSSQDSSGYLEMSAGQSSSSVHNDLSNPSSGNLPESSQSHNSLDMQLGASMPIVETLPSTLLEAEENEGPFYDNLRRIVSSSDIEVDSTVSSQPSSQLYKGPNYEDNIVAEMADLKLVDSGVKKPGLRPEPTIRSREIPTAPSRASLVQKDRSRVLRTRHLTSRFGHYLRRFTSTGDVGTLLHPLAPFLASQNDEGDNAVHLAVIHQPKNTWLFKHLMPVVSSLVQHSVINHTNNIYQTPLHMAVSLGETNVVQLLLLSGADPNCQDRRGNTPLQIAVLKKDKDCLAILLNKGLYNMKCKGQPLPNPDVLNYDGNSALHLAVKGAAEQCVSLLVDARADLNIRDGTSGRTPLHLAVEMQSLLIEFLLKQQAIDVNCQDYAGNTPLHLACAFQFPDVVLLLMEANANPLIRNHVPREQDDDDDDSSEDEEEDRPGTTPKDLVQKHPQILSILGGMVSKEVEKSLHNSRRMSIEERKSPQVDPGSKDPRTGHSSSNSQEDTQIFSHALQETSTLSDLGYASKEGPLSSCLLSQEEEIPSQETDAPSQEAEITPEVMKGLCQMLDPPSKDWEKLAGLLFENTDFFHRIKTLEKSPTTAVLKKLKSQGPFDLKSVLEAAGLKDAASYVSSKEKIQNV